MRVFRDLGFRASIPGEVPVVRRGPASLDYREIALIAAAYRARARLAKGR